MNWIDKLILPLSCALIIAGGSAVTRLAVVQADAKAAVEGIELPILMYHHILKEEARLNKFTISPAEFRADLLYLKQQGYETIVMQDLIDYVQNDVPLPEHPVMITFDDGYESFYKYAYPLLLEFDDQAVFSVVGRYVEQYSAVDDHHIRYSHATWEQLQEMSQSGLVEIQNHSYNLHSNDQGRLGAKIKSGENLAAYREMLSSDLGKLQQACETQLEITPTTFTYPFGFVCEDACKLISQMGFQAALTCEEKLNYITGNPEQLFHLRRFNRPHNLSAQKILQNAGASQ